MQKNIIFNMIYLKHFEDIDRIIPYNYQVGDIVASLITVQGLPKFKKNSDFNPIIVNLLTKGSKYKVLKIVRGLEDKALGTPYMRVDVEDVETGKKTYGWKSNHFELESQFDAKKYNI